MQLTDAQIAAYARQAGFTGDGLRWAVAVGIAESGGRTDAVGVNSDGSRDRGVWQINSRWHAEVSDAQAFDPASCAAAAYTISSGGTNWRPWSTFTNGAAAAQLGRATAAANTASSAGLIGPINPQGGIGGLLPLLPGLGAVPGPGGAGGSIIPGADALGGVATSLAAMGSILVHGAQWVGKPDNWLRVALVVAGGAGAIAGIVLLSNSGVGGPVGTVARGTTNTARKATSTARKAAVTTAKVAAIA